MKTYIALFFVALAVLQCNSAPASDSVESKESDSASAEKKMVCEPKTNFKQGCNNCFCALDGSGYACTKMACPPDVYNEDGSLKPQPSTMGEPIVASASEISEVIVETTDDVAQTTEAVAQTTEAIEQTTEAVEQTTEAVEKTTEAVEKTTEAVKEITEAVSEVASTVVSENIPKIQWGPLYVAGTPCPDKSFYSECNQCSCGKDGVSAACTLLSCEAFRSIHEQQNKDATVVA